MTEHIGRKREKNSDESFSVAVGDLSESVLSQFSDIWNNHSYTFTALDTTLILGFTSLDVGADTTGDVFDDVRISAVPEPSTMTLLLLGLMGLAVRQGRQG